MTGGSRKESARERRVWDLLTRDFSWRVPSDHPVKIYDTRGRSTDSARLQIFEVAITTVLADLRPEFDWWVTPAGHDGGLDFKGEQRFLDDPELKIEAAITVGGQCKKRTTVGDVLDEITGSVIKMAVNVKPTLFVVALSARLSRSRVDKARAMLEQVCQRHCHILDRTQIEGMFAQNLGRVTTILQAGLEPPEIAEVLEYLAEQVPFPPPEVNVVVPPRVLAGKPFRVKVSVRWALASDRAARLWWTPASAVDEGGTFDDDVADTDRGIVRLIAPIDADTPDGIRLAETGVTDDPLQASCTVELVTHSAGRVDLGSILVGLGDRGNAGRLDRRPLGIIDVVETLRPRYYAQPHREIWERLDVAYEQAAARAVTAVGIVGAGGSGKSRLCEEVALAQRRRGAEVITAKQAKTHEAPQRILADLLAGLAEVDVSARRAEEDVVEVVALYDQSLADRVRGAIGSIFGAYDALLAEAGEQDLLSALLLLVVVRSRRAPLIVHLQDMHWCSADVLLMFERLLSQMGQRDRAPVGEIKQVPDEGPGTLFLFEGRILETGGTGDEAWSSTPFEAFLDRSEVPQVVCGAFEPDDSLTFVRRLFEDRHNAHRLMPEDLIDLQNELVEQVHRTAGGNPFHTLEQVRLLRERRVIGQNSRTGLLYLIRPDGPTAALPDSVFAAIEARWRYLRERSPALALLLWGCALIDDQVPASLFQHLWRLLAPDVSLLEIDAADILWTGDGREHEAVFRHENYFASLRRFTVPEAERVQVVDAYCDWFAGRRRPGPTDRFRWARAELQRPIPDVAQVRKLLDQALRGALRHNDERLARRILTFQLDLIWTLDEEGLLPAATFVRHCDEEASLCRELLGMDREQAARRLQRLRERLEARAGASINVELRSLAAESVYAQLLFNDRRAAESAERIAGILGPIQAHRDGDVELDDWRTLEMEALYTLSCAQALSGDFPAAVRSSAEGSAIAETSSAPLARKVVSTYGTMMLSQDPVAGENILRGCLRRWPDDATSDTFLVHVHLAMALVLQAYPIEVGSVRRTELLAEAAERMGRVHHTCRRLGLYPDAGAAALVRGVVSALENEGDEAAWFAQGVAAAAKGRQMETLWRSHLNLAVVLRRKAGTVTSTAHDHAVAALEIMDDSLSPYSEPDQSLRFDLLRVGLGQAVSMLRQADDVTGLAVLERYPRLRTDFVDPSSGVLVPYDGGPRHYQWLHTGGVDVILY